MVDHLPSMAHSDGTESTMDFIQSDLRSFLSILAVGVEVPEAISGYFSRGQARLLCDDDEAGFRFRSKFKAVVVRLVFEPSARVVFERSSSTEARPYVPDMDSP